MSPRLRRKKILIADDEEAIRGAIRRVILSRYPKAEIEEAGDGFDAYLSLSRRRYDLLITDVRMPGVDGFTLVRTLRRLGDLKRPGGVIIISGAVDTEEAERETERFTYLAKPFQTEALLRHLERVLGAPAPRA